MLPDLLALWPLALLVLLTTLLTEWAVHANVLPYWISRKVLHIVAVGSCAFAPSFVASHLSLIAVVLPAWLLLMVLVASKKLMLDEHGRPAWGIVWFPLAYLLLLFFFDQPEQVGFPMLILAICDPAATIFGKTLGKKTYQLTGETKSLVGNAAFFAFFFMVCFVFFGMDHRMANPSWLFMLAIAGLLLTAAEALGSYGRDNLYVPLLAAVLFNAGLLDTLDAWVLHAIVLLAYPFYRFTTGRKSLSPDGAISAILLGTTIVITAGALFVLPLVVFFGSSVLVGKLFPHQTLSDQKDKQPRDAIQVICNGGVYLVLVSVLYNYANTSIGTVREEVFLNFKVAISNPVSHAWPMLPPKPSILLALISIAVSTADTWASEVGQYFRQPTYDFLRMKRVEPGLSGGVSISGTLAAILGSMLIASLGFLFRFDFDWIDFATVTAFGFIGMLIDSILGGLLQRQYYDGTRWSDTPRDTVVRTRGVSWVSNDVVNVLANVVAVLLAAVYLF